MENLTTPGIYFEPLQPLRVTGDLLRSDIAAFIGYAQKGPTVFPVRVDSWQKFLAIFGEPLVHGQLAFAVKGFFETGGQTCYVLRIVDQNAKHASLTLNSNNGQPLWQVYASFRPASIIANEESEQGRPDSAVLQNIAVDSVKQPVENPGSWGNGLQISISPGSKLSTRILTIQEEGFKSRIESMVGLEQYSMVELSQEQSELDGSKTRISRVTAIESLDNARQLVYWPESLLQGTNPFDPNLPIRLDSIEFDLQVEYEGRIVENFSGMGPHPEHSNSLHNSLSSQSQFVDLIFNGDVVLSGEASNDWVSDDFWPQMVSRLALIDGADGVSEISSAEYIQALEIISKVDEICIVAAPDLVLKTPLLETTISEVIEKTADCQSLLQPSKGVIYGEVNDGTNPLANVTITDAGTGHRVKSDNSGRFLLQELEISLRTLRFEKVGFEQAERQAFSEQTKPSAPAVFSLSPLAIARSLSLEEILAVQQAMANPVILGRYRVALLDPPAPDLKLEEIRSWRSQLGDSGIVALYYPWLKAPSPTQPDNELFEIPPCGHIAGILAQMDNAEGPHRSAANIKMRYAKGLSQSVNDTQHGLFNPESINVIRSMPGRGIRILGARSLSSDPDWRYFSTRRLVFALEKTLEETLQWAVFESNTTVLRQAVVLSIRSLLNRLWKQGALAGKTAEAAYQVKCDLDNNPQSERDVGKLLAEVAIAPSIPFEFIRIRFGTTLDAIEVTE